MKKKAYMAPAIEITEVKLMQMIAASISGVDINGDDLGDPEDDNECVEASGRKPRRSEWDEDDEW